MTSASWHHKVGGSFQRHATEYDQAARVQKQVAVDLVDSLMTLNPRGRLLEIGCGSGFLGTAMKQRGIIWDRAVFSDIALAMVGSARHNSHKQNRQFWVTADAARSCWRPAGFDFLCTSMVLHWLENPALALRELLPSVDRRGVIALAFPVQGSLVEWYDLCRHYGLESAPVIFPPKEIFKRELTDWHTICEDEKIYTMSYPSERDFLDELYRSGGAIGRPGHVPKPNRLRRLLREAPRRRRVMGGGVMGGGVMGGAARDWRVTWRIARIIGQRL